MRKNEQKLRCGKSAPQLFVRGGRGLRRRKSNVYAETREQCELKLSEMIKRVKAEIAEEKAKLKEGAE